MITTIKSPKFVNDEDVTGSIKEASLIIKDGGTVAFPTETVYGLGANALDKTAVSKIYVAKGRPSDNPLILHISEIKDLGEIVSFISDKAYEIARIFWPGPLTIIFNKSKIIPYEVTGGLETVAVRLPDNKIARELIKRAAVPIAAPSANISGRPSPTTAKHVFDDLNGKIPLILDGGNSSFGLESTILDLTEEVPIMLRPGAITLEMIEQILGKIDRASGNIVDGVPKAPGMKYKHYAPKARITIVKGEEKKVAAYINSKVKNSPKRCGIMATEETKGFYCCKDNIVFSLGERKNPESIAMNLFGTLRKFDLYETEEIYSEAFSTKEIGLAIMNRLKKAAEYNIVEV